MDYRYCTVFLLVNMALLIMVRGLRRGTPAQVQLLQYGVIVGVMWSGLWLLCQGAVWVTQHAADLHRSLLFQHFCANVLNCYLSPMLEGAKTTAVVVTILFVPGCLLLTKYPRAGFAACKWAFPMITLLTLLLAFCCEYWSLPLRWSKWAITDRPSLYLEDDGAVMGYRTPASVDWALREGELSVAATRDIGIYAEPTAQDAPAGWISQGTTYNLGELGFSYATVRAGWRYIPDQGYVKTKELCHGFLKSQNVLLRPLIRNNLLGSDILAAENGWYLTDDYHYRYVPIASCISLCFAICTVLLCAFGPWRVRRAKKPCGVPAQNEGAN